MAQGSVVFRCLRIKNEWFAEAVYRAWQGGVWRGSMCRLMSVRLFVSQHVYLSHVEERKLSQLQRAA